MGTQHGSMLLHCAEFWLGTLHAAHQWLDQACCLRAWRMWGAGIAQDAVTLGRHGLGRLRGVRAPNDQRCNAEISRYTQRVGAGWLAGPDTQHSCTACLDRAMRRIPPATPYSVSCLHPSPFHAGRLQHMLLLALWALRSGLLKVCCLYFALNLSDHSDLSFLSDCGLTVNHEPRVCCHPRK